MKNYHDRQHDDTARRDQRPHRPAAKKLYDSKAWKDLRRKKLNKCFGLCEKCLRAAQFTVAEIVHHKITLNKSNMFNVKITLSEENVECLCRKCHEVVHKRSETGRRYRFNPDGSIRF